MSQAEKAQRFSSLHRSGDPLFLYNIWDAGGAKIVAETGAQAIATGSMSVALAHGYEDGQQIPLDLVLRIVSRICETVDLPVTVDFEGGYAETDEGLATNVARLIATGAVGLNFEDQISGGAGLHSTEAQCNRIATIRKTAEAQGVSLFVNARTDLFLHERDRTKHAHLLDEAIARAQAYEKAGANGFFVPGLTDIAALKTICDAVSLPVNAMRTGTAPSMAELASAGIARISCGPGPYFDFVAGMKASIAARSETLTGRLPHSS
ncbi:isocitrate lyase/phosphoenolpyruvate mutase family protein [Rhizobiaceae bacterium BDR2-2]|uniref:Isocitrate lyase/phosphoenolpyruvate mutase family protein n=1 Tax=Ectorhizobium quercum TaxID=2965071 RepID=A0AAE3MYI6_9HYPH|nr:isocitrate lyase/phosphoenolpyruvate mutase family protein [Ectorhizobium quercum]MCX8997378.1 isocitrate lyase/phosphoenolpyruvate mutase family protein [Ectorhizobium quercum]